MRLEELKEIAAEHERLRALVRGIDRNLSGAPTERVDEYWDMKRQMVLLRNRAFEIQSACLNSYNKETACPKCHFGVRITKFQKCYLRNPFAPTMEFVSDDTHIHGAVGFGYLMVRGCPQCGAETFEKPLDRS